MLLADVDTFAYQRDGTDGRIIVVAHRSPVSQINWTLPVAHGGIADGCCFVDFFSGVEQSVVGGKLPLPFVQQGASLWIEMS